MTDYLNVGKTVNTQGIKGEVRVISKTNFPEERYQKGTMLLLFQERRAPIELIVKSHRRHKSFDILSFEGYPNINDVEKYRDDILKVAGDNLVELAGGEFYYHQIVGVIVYDEIDNELGKVKKILSPDVNDVWVIRRPKKEGLPLPYTKGVVTKVDVENQRIDVDIPEGLTDDGS